MQTFKLIPVDLGDGRDDRRLKYTGPGVIQIERAQNGASFILITRTLLRAASLDAVATYTWGGLLWQDPELKLEDVQEAVFRKLCNGHTIPEQLSPIIEALMECGLLAGRKKEEEGNGAEDPQKRATESPPPSETGTSESSLN